LYTIKGKPNFKGIIYFESNFNNFGTDPNSAYITSIAVF